MVVRERLARRSTGRGGPRPASGAGGTGPEGPGRRAARLGVIGVLVGALVMLVAAGALAASGSPVSFLGLGAADDGGGSVGDGGGAQAAPTLTTDPGRCLAWTRDDAADVAEVPCASAHLFETVGAVAAPLPPGAPFPADDAWQQLVSDRCTPLASAYLGGKLDPFGRYRAGALKPTRSSWDGGNRTVRCGMQAPGRTGALYPSTGRVADADQAAVYGAGVCLGLAGKEVSDPVDCSGPHAAEVAGTITVAGQFPGAYPAVGDQDDYLQPTCTKVAQDYVGGADKLTDSKLTVYWANIAPESWNAGTRRIDCTLGALLPDGSGFAPLTGRAATGVTIGTDAASVPSLSAQPGAPARLPSDSPSGGGVTAASSTPAAPGVAPTSAPTSAASPAPATPPVSVLPLPTSALPGG